MRVVVEVLVEYREVYVALGEESGDIIGIAVKVVGDLDHFGF